MYNRKEFNTQLVLDVGIYIMLLCIPVNVSSAGIDLPYLLFSESRIPHPSSWSWSHTVHEKYDAGDQVTYFSFPFWLGASPHPTPHQVDRTLVEK